MKKVTLGEFLTREEIELIMERFDSGDPNFRLWVKENIIKPNLDRINLQLGQENDPDYLSYMIEYVFSAKGNGNGH